MPHPKLRIVSLIPSATEIVAALGLEDALVGRSHECDYPATVRALPICTAPNLDPQGTSREIHDRVEDLLQSVLSIYRIDLEALERLRPTHILTQAQCEVCAVSLSDVETAVAQLTRCSAQIISLQPSTLEEVWADIRRVGDAVGAESDAAIAALRQRVATVQQQVRAFPHRPRVASIEWTDPLMAAGNWVPELIALAGGENLFGSVGKHSPWMEWDELLQADPDLLAVMPCGFDLEQTRRAAIADLAQNPHWQTLKAVRQGQVYLTDGNQYFNRPGPRLVDSLEILAEIFHPELNYGYEHRGWARLYV
ncbi:cobalamin-binding protein [Altericista sp. CCNU0014]|uniref:cobalamin-binding protein n=1 Tax=Altericista sp. CCNU0014 TaxID=3082949 RepID=UPI00384D3FE5